MKTFLISFALSLLGVNYTKAQLIPVEVMSGTDNQRYQHALVLTPDSTRFGFFTTSSLQIFNESRKENEIMSQSYLTFQLRKGVKLAAGSFYATGPGFRPSVAVQFSISRPTLFLMAAPRVDVWRNPSAELMAFIEFRPKVTATTKLYTRLQIMENFSRSSHNRSYQHIRIGLDVARVQFGLASNFEAYGPEFTYRPNYGIFVRKELKY